MFLFLVAGEDPKITNFTTKKDVNGNNNALSSSPPDVAELTSTDSTPVYLKSQDELDDNLGSQYAESQNNVLAVNECIKEEVTQTKEEEDLQGGFEDDLVGEESQEFIDAALSSASDLDITDELDLSSQSGLSSKVHKEPKQENKENLCTFMNKNSAVEDFVNSERDASVVNGNYNHSNNCSGNDSLVNNRKDLSEKNLVLTEECRQERETKPIVEENPLVSCEEDDEVAEIFGIQPDECDRNVTEETQSNSDGVSEADILESIAEIDQVLEAAEEDSLIDSRVSVDSRVSGEGWQFNWVIQPGISETDTVENNSDGGLEAAIRESLAEIDLVLETAEREILYGSEDNLSVQASPSVWEDQGDISRPDSISLSDSEVEMGRRRLSFKRKQQHMVYTEDEFREQYTNIERGKSLDSAARQDVKRGFQRLKAERAGARPTHTRSLSTPTAESYSGKGPPPRSKSGRPISMVERGTDTTEFFKDHQNTEADIRIRGLLTPNETNNNKNFDAKAPAPLTIEVKPELEIKPHKAQNLNAALEIKPQKIQNVNSARTPKFPNDRSSRGPLTHEDLSIMSGYPEKQNGTPNSPSKISLTMHLQNSANVNGDSRNMDSRKTKIAVERQMMIKQSIKGSPDDRLSPRATTSPTPTSPVNGSITRTTSKSKTPPPKAPKPMVQGAGPYTVITRIVDGEEEVTIGNIPVTSRPQSAPVVPSPRPHHFAVIEPVGQQVVGHPPRISQIEPVLVYPAKRSASQQSQPVTTIHVSTGPPGIQESLDDGNVDGPDTLSAMMSVTVTASTMPELQKPEVTTVEHTPVSVTNGATMENKYSPDKVKDDVIVPKTEVIVEAKKELPPVETVETDAPLRKQTSVTDTKATSPVVPNTPKSAKSVDSSRNRFQFPSIGREESIEITDSDDEEERGIYDASFRNSGWIYIGGNQELQMITGPMPPQQQQRLRQQQGKPEPNSKGMAFFS